MDKVKKILFITYHFPPNSTVGSIRPAKFVKYLSRSGWQPYVLTIKEKYISVKDYERMKEVQHVQIIRTSVWPTILQLVLKLRDKLLYLIGINRNIYYLKSTPSLFASKKNNVNGSLLRRIATSTKRLFISILELPDQQIGWFIPAIWKGFWLIKKEGIKIIIISSPPRSTALVGPVLSKLTGSKLITDLRDPWFSHGGKSIEFRSTLSDKIEIWMEKKIMEISDKVITTTDLYTKFLQTYYSSYSEDKFYTLYNGYDLEDFTGLVVNKSDNKFTISYLGTFYLSRTPSGFLDAISQLIKEKMISANELEINFIVLVRHANGQVVEDLVNLYGLAECVRIYDLLPYKESLIQMKMADILLLFATQEQYYAIPAKTFEYLGMRKKILCIGKDGATADLIRKTGSGIVVDPDNIEQIKKTIHKLYIEHKAGLTGNNIKDLAIYERKYLAERLSILLEKSIFQK